MKQSTLRQRALGALTPGLFACAPATGLAAEADWQYDATLYLWGASIQAETADGAEAQIPFASLIDHLNMAFMGAFEARQSRWGLGADVIALDVGANDSGQVPLRAASGARADLGVRARVQTKGWVINLTGFYNLLKTEQVTLDLLIGARYLDLALNFDLGLAAGRYTLAREFAPTQATWDGVAGIKGRATLNGPWFIPYHFDAGAGESDFTWQAAAGLGYTFKQGEVALVYRHVAWEFSSRDALDQINFSGPQLSGTWHF